MIFFRVLLLTVLSLTPWFSYSNPSLPGGKGTFNLEVYPSFAPPFPTLTAPKKGAFYSGRALAQQPWIKAPTATNARDGLGPIYNTRTCLACHVGGGRGTLPAAGARVNTAVVKISLPGTNKKHGVLGLPTYGDQLQTQSTALLHQLKHIMPAPTDVRPEAYLSIQWQPSVFTYPDKTQVALRKPLLNIQELGYSALPKDTLFSLRIAPPLHGLGLLQAIPEAAINKNADPTDKNTDGISGKRNTGWNFETNQPAKGRFGWKATRPDIKNFVAAAFASDIGITNALFPAQPCTKAQTRCQQQPDGNGKEGVELPAHLLQLVVDFTAYIAVPKARPLSNAAADGQAYFMSIGCANCHTPSFKTQKIENAPLLSKQTIWPYSDLLLHDMGPGLADSRPDYDATGQEWRTPPLWGVGINLRKGKPAFLLHDGRAQTIEEAILWHAGEAAPTKQRFISLTKEKRTALINFVETL